MIGIIVLVFAVLPVAFALPLNSAFLAGIASARDPGHRLTPRSPWFFFDRVVKRRLRWWWVVWGFVLLGIFFPALALRGRMALPLEFSFVYAMFAAGRWFLTVTACVFWAPRCERFWMLVFLTLLSTDISRGLFLCCALKVSDSVFVPGQHAPYLSLVMYGTFTIIPCFLFAVGAWLWARRKDERWFRFEH